MLLRHSIFGFIVGIFHFLAAFIVAIVRHTKAYCSMGLSTTRRPKKYPNERWSSGLWMLDGKVPSEMLSQSSIIYFNIEQTAIS